MTKIDAKKETKPATARGRYENAQAAPDDFNAADQRFFEVNAIMAKLEENSLLSNDFKGEMQYHFQNFCRLNKE